MKKTIVFLVLLAFALSAQAQVIVIRPGETTTQTSAQIARFNSIFTYTAAHDTIGFHANPVVQPWGKVAHVTAAGNDYFAVVGSDDHLDPGYSDWALYAYTMVKSDSDEYDYLFRSSATGSNNTQAYIYPGNTMYFRIQTAALSYVQPVANFPTDRFVNVFVYYDRDGSMYIYLDGHLVAVKDISGLDGENVDDPSSNFVMHYYASNDREWYDGVVRVFNFGTNPTVDHATLARRLAGRPTARLSEIGYGEWEDANRSELVVNGDFSSGLASWTTVGTPTTAETTTVDGSVRLHVVADAGYEGEKQTSIAAAGGMAYELSFEYKVVSGNLRVDWTDQSGYGFYANDGLSATSWSRFSVVKVLPSDIITQSIYLRSSGSGAAEFYVDNVSVHRVGEVAFWKFNDASSSTVFADETSNGNDLVPYKSGSATTAGDLQADAVLNHMWEDYVHGDTLSAEIVRVGQTIVPYDSAGPTGGVDVGSSELHFDDAWFQTYNTASADLAEAWHTSKGSLKMALLTWQPNWRAALLDLPVWKAKNVMVTLTPDKPTRSDSSTWMPLDRFFKHEKKRGALLLEAKKRGGVPDTLYVWYRPNAVRPGDVVVLDLETPDPFDVKLCETSNPTSWWGVVSKNPALLMGQRYTEGGAPVAYVGRVRAKVRGPVKAGDLLVPDGKGALAPLSALGVAKPAGMKYAVALKGFEEPVVKRIPVLLQ